MRLRCDSKRREETGMESNNRLSKSNHFQPTSGVFVFFFAPIVEVIQLLTHRTVKESHCNKSKVVEIKGLCHDGMMYAFLFPLHSDCSSA